MKKLISVFLAIVIIALASPLCYAAVYESYSYEVNSDNTITITRPTSITNIKTKNTPTNRAKKTTLKPDIEL